MNPSLPIRVTFNTEVNRAAVETSFRVEPAAAGSFEWPDERTVVWHPKGLRPAQGYRVQAGGASSQGEAIRPVQWRFQTSVPPPRIAPGRGEKLVLTFDDDPRTPEHAYQLLDVLARHRVRAIFFPTGAWAAAHPEFAERALAQGHFVCNHTHSHADLTKLSPKQIRFEIQQGAGRGQCDLLRPPYGRSNTMVEWVVGSLGYRLYWWNIDSRDWEGRSAQSIADIVLGTARPGGVAIFHMHGAHTLEALPAIIETLRGAGYELTY